MRWAKRRSKSIGSPCLGGRAVRIQRCKIMRPNSGQFVWIVLLGAMFLEAAPASGQIWKQFVPTSRPAADPRPANDSPEPRAPRGANEFRPRPTDASADGYALTQD